MSTENETMGELISDWRKGRRVTVDLIYTRNLKAKRSETMNEETISKVLTGETDMATITESEAAND